MLPIESIKGFFLGRKSVLTLITLSCGAVLLSGLVPQRVATPPEDIAAWRAAHPQFLTLMDTLGLHSVYTTPWFALLILLVLIALLSSTCQQIILAWNSTFRRGAPAGTPDLLLPCGTAVTGRLQTLGYLKLQHGVLTRHVKQPWGYWGNVLFHFGLALTIGASLFIALTQQRGVIYLNEGGMHRPDEPWLSEEHGLLAEELRLPEAVRFERLRLSFTGADTVERVASDLTFIDRRGGESRCTVGINDILSHGDLAVYQRSDYGDVFTVQFTDSMGRTQLAELPIPHPETARSASYRTFGFDWLPYQLSTKYYADAAKQSVAGANPELTLRLLDRGKKEFGRVTLAAGAEGGLGEYRLRLVDTRKWTGFIFVRLHGMRVVFAAFFIAVLGGIVHYFTPPRELLIVSGTDGERVYWRAARFADFYLEEREEILASLKGDTDG